MQMAIVSTELREIFRAYTRQLSGEYAKARSNGQATETRARGFERVDISVEARALALGISQAKSRDSGPPKPPRTSRFESEDNANTPETDPSGTIHHRADQPDTETKRHPQGT
jgi:hypothetical protein